MKELGVKMIAAHSPQAGGRSERSFGTWQGRLPQEFRLAGINAVEGANRFLREQYVKEFNGKFRVAAAEKGTAFRRTGRSDLNWIFSVQTERVVAKDNTVAIRERFWQIDKTRFRHSLAGTTVTIHEHLDETVSMRYGPHVVGRYSRTGEKLISTKPKPRRGKGGSMEAGENQKQVFTGSHPPLEISLKARDSHFSTAPTMASVLAKRKAKAKTNPPHARQSRARRVSSPFPASRNLHPPRLTLSTRRFQNLATGPHLLFGPSICWAESSFNTHRSRPGFVQVGLSKMLRRTAFRDAQRFLRWSISDQA